MSIILKNTKYKKMKKQADAKYEKYKELLLQDEHGFVESQKCDSLLFTGLTGCVPGVSMNILAAFDPTTQTWKRRPIEKVCYPEHSSSSISRDMLVGLAWYCWKHDRKDIAEKIVDYALSHWMIMGEAATLKAKIGRCFLGLGLLGTFARISGKRRWLWWLPTDLPGAPILKDYQAHLQVLHRLLRHKMKGTDSSKDRILKAQASRQPHNPLFQVAIGNHSGALETLSDSRYWPLDRLPTVRDRHEAWLPMRDFGSDWKPGFSDHTHSGGDFLFVYGLLNGDI